MLIPYVLKRNFLPPIVLTLACISGMFVQPSLRRASGQEPSEAPQLLRVEAYEVELTGLAPFRCREIKNIGVEITAKPGGPPTKSKILDIVLTREFKLDRPFHDWIDRARRGAVEPKNGTIRLLNADGLAIVRFNIAHAWPRRWVVNLPEKGEKTYIPEIVTLRVRDMEMVY